MSKEWAEGKDGWDKARRVWQPISIGVLVLAAVGVYHSGQWFRKRLKNA